MSIYSENYNRVSKDSKTSKKIFKGRKKKYNSLKFTRQKVKLSKQ